MPEARMKPEDAKRWFEIIEDHILVFLIGGFVVVEVIRAMMGK